jgi:hypothetical protein
MARWRRFGEHAVTEMNPMKSIWICLAAAAGVAAAAAPAPDELRPVGRAVVKSVKGSAYYRVASGDWMPLAVGRDLSSGTFIRTGASSLAAYELLLKENNSVVRVKSETAASLARINFDPSAAERPAKSPPVPRQGQVFTDSRAPVTGGDFAQFDIGATGSLQVSAGTLLIAYFNPDQNKPVQVMVGAGQSFRPPAPLPGGRPAPANPVTNARFSPAEPVFEVTIAPPTLQPAGRGVEPVSRQLKVNVAVVSP